MKKGFGILAIAPEAPPQEAPAMEADMEAPAAEEMEGPPVLAFTPPQGVKVPETEPGKPFTMPAMFKMEGDQMVLCGVDGKMLPGHEDAGDPEMEEIKKMPMEERGKALRGRLEKESY